MNEGGQLFPEIRGERAFVEIGGIPYRCRVVPTVGLADYFPPDVKTVMLEEQIGNGNAITADPATTYYGAGTMMPASWDGTTRHISTGLPLYHQYS
jgi:hypothetical protein